MTMIATTKKTGTFIPGSGIGFNRGKIAGGRTTTPGIGRTGVFGQRPYVGLSAPNLKGGLIDKQQQANPSSTANLNHPFDSPGYRPVATQPQKKPLTTVNNLPSASPLGTVAKTPTTDRGTFFQRKVAAPVVKTQFGANKSGMKSNTAFHPNPLPKQPAKIGAPQVDSAKLVNKITPPSFLSHSNLWQDPNNSFIKGHATPSNPDQLGKGRWNTVKRSVV